MKNKIKEEDLGNYQGRKLEDNAPETEWEFGWQNGFKKGKEEARKEVLKFIENKRRFAKKYHMHLSEDLIELKQKINELSKGEK